MLNDFRKGIAFLKVSRLRPFGLLVRTTCSWIPRYSKVRDLFCGQKTLKGLKFIGYVFTLIIASYIHICVTIYRNTFPWHLLMYNTNTKFDRNPFGSAIIWHYMHGLRLTFYVKNSEHDAVKVSRWCFPSCMREDQTAVCTYFTHRVRLLHLKNCWRYHSIPRYTRVKTDATD